MYTLPKAKGSFLINRVMLQEGSLTPFTKPHGGKRNKTKQTKKNKRTAKQNRKT